jgi:hypothetical protein
LPTPFTVLTGVLGYGEHRQPWHPQSSAFARLLLERGADPNDGQTLYNRMFGSDDDHLVLPFEYGLGSDTRSPWHRLLGESLESPTEMLRSLLAWAIVHDQATVLPCSPGTVWTSSALHRTAQSPPRHAGRSRSHQRPPRAGRPAPRSRRPAGAALSCRRLRRGRTRPGRRCSSANSRASHRHRTTKADRAGDLGRGPGAPNAVELLATAGFDVNALGRSDILSNQPWHTALHVAAENGNLALARTLLQLGADPNIPDKHYQSTPLEWARHSGQPALAELLEPLTQQP